MIGAIPRRAHEAPGRALGERRAGRQRVLQRLERRADVVAQKLEPGARTRLALGDRRCQVDIRGHGSSP
jgi:hypothetical protein